MLLWPAGFIVTGDAVCAFNPIYGHGMTVCALDAMTLKGCLQELQHSPRADFEQYFQKQLAKTISPAWFLATTEDLRRPTVKLRAARPSPVVSLLLKRYLDLVLYGSIIDPDIAQAYFNVLTLATPPSSLVRPHIVAHAFVAASRRGVRRLLGVKEVPDFTLSPKALSTLSNRLDYRNKPASFIERKL